MVNQTIGHITKATVTEKKSALKRIALSSPQNFQTLIRDLLANDPAGYDFQKDKKGFEALRQALLTAAQQYPLTVAPPSAPTMPELMRVVAEITGQFKQLIENNNLSHLLWDGSKPRSQKVSSASLLRCRSFLLQDEQPRYLARGSFRRRTGRFQVLDWICLRCARRNQTGSGTVVHGYETQLEIYKTASQTDEGPFLIINVGSMGSKLSRVQKIQQEQVKAGKKASAIVVVDATKKASASKR